MRSNCKCDTAPRLKRGFLPPGKDSYNVGQKKFPRLSLNKTRKADASQDCLSRLTVYGRFKELSLFMNPQLSVSMKWYMKEIN
jgi:hypothetical protein